MTTTPNHTIPANGSTLTSLLNEFHTAASRTAGMEMERFLVKSDNSLPSAQEHDEFYRALYDTIGDSTSVETGAHMIEIKTGIHDDPLDMSGELNAHLSTCKRLAEQFGLLVVPSSDMKGYTPHALLQNPVSRVDPVTSKVRRAYEMPKAYLKQGWDHMAAYGCSTTSIQLTHSVTDADHLYRWAKVHSAMAPLYYAVFENRTRQDDHRHTALAVRRSLGRQGLIADYVFNARNAEDFVNQYAQFVTNTKMLTMLDDKGQDYMLARPMKFDDLPEENRTLGNLLQAASCSWNVCKIRAVVDEDSLPTGNMSLKHLLIEARDMDVSDKAVPAIAGWFFALTESDDSLAQAEYALESLGIPVLSNPQLAGERSNVALNLIERSQGYLDLPYGDRTLRDAVREVILPILRASGDPGNALPLWKDVAASSAPAFRVAETEPATPELFLNPCVRL